jgi:uncharacterized protein YqfB (UPF0267 family)
MIFFIGMAALFLIGNFYSDNRQDHWGFYATVIGFVLLPLVITIPYYILTAKTITIEEDGVAEYKKGELKQKLRFEDISSICITNPRISIMAAKNGFHLGDITFSNNRKGFAEYELPFLVEIVKRCDFRIKPEQIEAPKGYWLIALNTANELTNKRMAMLNEAIIRAREDYNKKTI